MQAAAHREVFEVLRDQFDCRLECFASPLNCRYPRFCSMFADTDAPFGSLGSFCAFRPQSGSFQANPPFDEHFVERMAEHMFALLGAAKVCYAGLK
jgi:Phosphorylated CTD interacting factor 1 WW domain